MFGTFFKYNASPGATQNSPPIELEKFEHLPKPALFSLMLQLDRDDLIKLCASSRVANEICKIKKFREDYAKLHPVDHALLKDNADVVGGDPYQDYDQYNSLGFIDDDEDIRDYTLTDPIGNKLIIYYVKNNGKKNVRSVVYIPSYQPLQKCRKFTADELKNSAFFYIHLVYGNNPIQSTIYISPMDEDVVKSKCKPDEYLEIQEKILKYKDASNWIKNIVDNYVHLNKEAYIDFLRRTQVAVFRYNLGLDFTTIKRHANKFLI